MIGNLVLETTTTTGTGNITIAATLRSFNSVFGTGSSAKFYYGIFNETGTEYEFGIGYLSAATTLVRETVLESSNANALVNFSAGTKKVVNDTYAAYQQPGIIPQVSKSAAYTLILDDAGKHIFHPSADTTARVWTIPANSSVPYKVGTAITFVNQNSAGVITISITSDTMRLGGLGTTGSRTLAANGIATALKVSSTEWIISGTGLS